MNTIQSSRQSITVGFSMMLVLLLGMGILAVNYMNDMQDRLDNIVNIHNLRSNSYNIMRNIARERSLILYQMNINRDIFFTDAGSIRMSRLAGDFISHRENLLTISSAEDSGITFEDILPDVLHSTSIQRDVINLLEKELYDEANTLLTETSIPIQNALLKKYDNLAESEQKKSSIAAKEAARQYKLSLYSMTILGVLLLGIGIFTSVFVIRRVTHAEHNLFKLNTELEERVVQRTDKLSQANEELQNAQSQLVQSEKMASLGSLVAGISHEINTPVGIAVTAITYQQEQSIELEKDFKSGNMKRSDLENFVTEIQHSNELIINNLRRASEMVASFKRVAVDQSSEHWETINLYDYINSTILSLHPKLKHRHIQINNNCNADVNIFTNPGAIYQILSNLILNSLIHAFEQTNEGSITLECHQQQDIIYLSYSDNGKGMSELEQSKAFDPFYTTKRGQGGSGLGLHLVYNLVTSGLGGTIKLSSTPNEGAQFNIELPVNTPN